MLDKHTAGISLLYEVIKLTFIGRNIYSISLTYQISRDKNRTDYIIITTYDTMIHFLRLFR